jgi:hypothetical protein
MCSSGKRTLQQQSGIATPSLAVVLQWLQSIVM